MDLFDVMRTTPATRDFAPDALPDATVAAILENARFAASGRNAQPWRVIAVRDAAERKRISDAAQGAFREYVAQLALGREPFSASDDGVWREPDLDLAAARANEDLPHFGAIEGCSVLLVVCADLSKIAFLDAMLDRQSLIGGGSVYPFVQNILLGLRHEGFGGVPDHLRVSRGAGHQQSSSNITRPWVIA